MNSFFPPNGGSISGDSGNEDYLKKAPPGTEGALRKIVGLIRPVHFVMQAIIEKNVANQDKGTKELQEAIRNIDLTDEDTITALMSIMLAAGVQISPKTYGNDYNKWEKG